MVKEAFRIPMDEERSEFENRAGAFATEHHAGRGFQKMMISGSELHVGTGEHEGLVAGKSDLWLLDKVMLDLQRLYRERMIIPDNYVMVKLLSYSGVQVFIERPILNDLMNYLRSKMNAIYLDQLSSRGIDLCETFYSEQRNRKVTLEMLMKIEHELYQHSIALVAYGRRTIFANRNILILNAEDDGRVAIAPVDVE
jgi:hypothetical protein